MQLINEGQREFAKDVYGMMSEDYLTITPLFDIQTDFAFSLALNGGTATDVCITATDFTNCTAGTVATQLVTALTAQAATCTITFASASWYFTITFGATISSAVFASPTTPIYIDGLDMIMGAGASFTAPTCTGSRPEDLGVEASLPSGFLYAYHVEWDGNALSQAPADLFLSPEYEGTPAHYWVYGKKMRLFPSPTSQKRLHIWYKKHPADWASLTQSASSIDLDAEWAMAPVYYAAALTADMNFEKEISGKLHARYINQVRQYNRQWNNQNPAMFPEHEPGFIPIVSFTSA
jgi:hypothetical protein